MNLSQREINNEYIINTNLLHLPAFYRQEGDSKYQHRPLLHGESPAASNLKNHKTKVQLFLSRVVQCTVRILRGYFMVMSGD